LKEISVKNKSGGFVPFLKFVNNKKVEDVKKEEIED
jgi:hypothetical protein